MQSHSSVRTRLWLIDGYNVLHAVVLKRKRDVEWWQPEYQQRVLEWVTARLETFLPDAEHCSGDEVIIVFDASRTPPADTAPQHDVVRIVYAPNADAWMVSRCKEASQSAHDQAQSWRSASHELHEDADGAHDRMYPVARLVTADRSLADRALVHGASTVKPWDVDM